MLGNTFVDNFNERWSACCSCCPSRRGEIKLLVKIKNNIFRFRLAVHAVYESVVLRVQVEMIEHAWIVAHTT